MLERTLRLFLFLTSWLLAAASSSAEKILYEQEIRLGPAAIPIKATVDGQKAVLGLDTGAIPVILDPALRPASARQLSLVRMHTFGRELIAEEIARPQIRLGKWQLSPGRAVIADCTKFKAVTGFTWQGYLGMSAMDGAAIDVNFDRRRLRLIKDMKPPPGTVLYTPEVTSGESWYLPLKSSANDPLPWVDVTIANTRVTALIDTGCGGVIGLRHDIFEKFVQTGMIERLAAPAKAVVGAGAITEQTGRFTSGDLWGMPLQGWRVFDANTESVIGLYFLMNLNFTVDPSAKRFYFACRSSRPLNAYACLGMSLRYEQGHCYAARIDPEGQASKDPAILEGDSIIKLGPLRTADINVFSIHELCQSHFGQTIQVEFIHAGEKKSVKKLLTLRYPELSGR